MGVAVGYIHEAHSGLSVETERAAIEARARSCRLELVELLVLPRDCYMPITHLYQAIAHRAATVVIVPTAEHVWTARRGLTEHVRVEVVAPSRTWARGTVWPSPVGAR